MSAPPEYQDLERFEVPPGFRGRNVFVVQAWRICQATLFALSPQPMYGWRSFLLRVFGAQIGKGVKIRQSARVTYPWKVGIGDFSWVGDRAELYSLDDIRIGSHCCISQDCYLAASGHDYEDISFGYTPGKIVIEDEAWLASGVYVMPGTRVGRGAVAAARSVLTRDVEEAAIVAGIPARVIGKRKQGDG